MNMDQFFHSLEHQQSECWKQIHQGPFWSHLLSNGLDKGLYIHLMAEIFHYTRHNTQNQALAAVKLDSNRLSLMRYCLHHAQAESGHDLMVLRDLNSIGVDSVTIKNSTPLPETQAFVAYLYCVASYKDATARLGYSYWAEGCYTYIGDLLSSMRRDLSLKDGQMTFFVEHSSIDAIHLEEVKRVIRNSCTEEHLQHDLLDVMRTSLYLTGKIFDACYQAYVTPRLSIHDNILVKL